MSYTLHARRLNYGQSEIWLDDDSKRRTIATNAVVWAVRKNCNIAVAESFYETLHESMGNVAEVLATDAIVAELGLAK